MALADNILSATRRAFHEFRIRGISRNKRILDCRYTESLDQPCPVVTLDTNLPAELLINLGDSVTVDLGYGGLNRRVFTGTAQNRSRPSVERGNIECAGELWKLIRSTFDEPRDVGGLTVAQAITAIFADCNISNYDLTAVPAYTLAANATIAAGTGMAQLTELLKVDGLRVRETGAGQVIVARYEGAPSASYFRQYTTDGANIRILGGGVTEDPGWYRTQITVAGATLTDGSAVTSTVTLSDTSLAQPPLAAGKQIADTFNITLIWTAAKALEAATRIAAERGRIPQSFRMTVPLDPQLEIGMTLGISAPEWGVTGNWLIWAITHNTAADTTEVDLRGGPQFGGTINVNPVVCFELTAENQPLGAQRYTFVTADASCSYQPDNLAEVLTYDWAGNQDAADSPDIDSQTAVKFTTRIDPTGITELTVTLTITNAAGLTATASKTINITPEGGDAIVVAIAAALKTRFGFSGDGGENWNFQTGTDITSCAVASPDAARPLTAVYGRDNGQIYLTTDGCATAPTSVKASNSIAIVDLKWDWRDPTRVWALDAQCKLWLSSDYGASFVEIVTWRTSMALATIIGKRLFLHQDGYTYVGGGTGVVGTGRPFIGRFKSGESPFGFASAFGGDLNTDLGSGSTTLAIADWHFDTTGGLIIVLENYTAYNSGVRPAYWVPTDGSDLGPMNADGWKRIGSAEGLDSGVTTAGRVALPGNGGPGYFHLMFNDRDAWHINTTSGTPVATVTADFLDAGFTSNEGIWLADETEGIPSAECHILAVQDAGGNGAIIKSFDDMVTQADILPGMTAWPVVGAQGKDIAIGPPAQLGTAAKIIIGGHLATPTERFIAWRTGQANFTAHIFPTNLDSVSFHQIRAITSQLWFGLWAGSSIGPTDAVVVRTKDGGATWDDLYTPVIAASYAFQDIARAADGRLWGVATNTGDATHIKIGYSDDDGDTWTESKDDNADPTNERIFRMIAHPTNRDRIYALGRGGHITDVKSIVTWFTTDRGATWTRNIFEDIVAVNGYVKTHGAMVLPSNRLVTVGVALTTDEATIWTSDDNGASWDPRKAFADVVSPEQIYGPVGDPFGTMYVMVNEQGVSPYDIQIWASSDQAQTWTQVASDALANGPPQPSATDIYRGGIGYDPTEGAIYLFGAGEGNADNIAQIVKSVGLGWQDVSDNLIAALTGHTRYSLANHMTYGIAVIPS